ncbi:MAG: metal ABC transporter substrate-binding protein [Acidimicrobiia bacterium]|nr:metal ABC transporter substrate-binding protein [Acidimicrobiia bacterium]
MTGRMTAVVLAVALLVAACGGDGETGRERLLVVATTTILGDVVANVAGDDADVETLLPVGADPHDFQPSARDIARLREADLVVANGLGLEAELTDALEAAADDGVRILTVAPGLDPIPFAGDGEDEDHANEEDHAEEDHADEEGHTDHGELDPHVWMDPLRMADAARAVAAELDDLAEGDWASRAEAYAAELEALDAEIAGLVAGIPAAERVLVTNHEALGYFAERYGFQVVGVVVPGGSTMGDPSSAELAGLVETMRETGVRAVFAETIDPSGLADAVAAEVGGAVAVVELYTGSLGPEGSGAETLVDLLRLDAQRIVDALS